MKRFFRLIIDATVVRLVRYVIWCLPGHGTLEVAQPLEIAQPLSIIQRRVVGEVLHRAVVSSADYAELHMPDALGFPEITDLWRYAFVRRRNSGLIVEFGVWQARSVNFFADLTSEQIYGFDSFEGLKEDWKGWQFPKGHFDLGGEIPAVPPNVTLIKGWFDLTLPDFLASHPEPFSFVHIDCDTYEGAATILKLTADRFVPGTVVLMDEYFGYRGWKIGEFKAWQDFVAASGLSYDYIAFCDEPVAVLIRHRGPIESD
jgi:hypothetical protein